MPMCNSLACLRNKDPFSLPQALVFVHFEFEPSGPLKIHLVDDQERIFYFGYLEERSPVGQEELNPVDAGPVGGERELKVAVGIDQHEHRGTEQ